MKAGQVGRLQQTAFRQLNGAGAADPDTLKLASAAALVNDMQNCRGHIAEHGFRTVAYPCWNCHGSKLLPISGVACDPQVCAAHIYADSELRHEKSVILTGRYQFVRLARVLRPHR